MAVYGYIRVSTDEQAADDRHSLDAQRGKIKAVALLTDLKVDRFFVDLGVSGAIPMAERPDGKQMLACLQPGDRVIAAKMDRAFRSASDALATAETLKARKVDLVLIDIGTDPVTQNGAAKLFFTMLAAVAEFERDTIKARMMEGKKGKAAAGGHVGGKTPFGYTKVGTGRDAKLLPDPAQQAAICDMTEMNSSGMSSRTIAAAVAVRHGVDVSHVTVAQILRRSMS